MTTTTTTTTTWRRIRAALCLLLVTTGSSGLAQRELDPLPELASGGGGHLTGDGAASGDDGVTPRDGFLSETEGSRGGGLPGELGMRVLCGSDGVELRVEPSFFLKRGIQLPDLHLNDRRCGGVALWGAGGGGEGGEGAEGSEEGAGRQRSWLFRTDSLTSCGTRVTRSESLISYSNALRYTERRSPVLRYALQLNFTCTYPAAIIASLPGDLHPELTQVEMELSASGVLVASLLLLASPDISDPVRGALRLRTAEPLFVGARLHNDSATLALLLESCWASASPEPRRGTPYPLIGPPGCPVEESVSIHQGNGVNTSAVFSVKVFTIIDADSVYIHCQLGICAGSCAPDCDGLAEAQGSDPRSGVQGHHVLSSRRIERVQSEESDSMPEDDSSPASSSSNLLGLLALGGGIALVLCAAGAFLVTAWRARARGRERDLQWRQLGRRGVGGGDGDGGGWGSGGFYPGRDNPVFAAGTWRIPRPQIVTE
ncbi:uromodulin-like isoform X2 [Lethenteron reissneri]|uniref:uromodulin-like isoform X2 n=1 Tax=Lethenteron reissneri TaxID=7753 RepID=UPI002AB766E7|nr:uromodulin-like isoform X2 [Lethenteron reissneri]